MIKIFKFHVSIVRNDVNILSEKCTQTTIIICSHFRNVNGKQMGKIKKITSIKYLYIPQISVRFIMIAKLLVGFQYHRKFRKQKKKNLVI